jgi:very-short-patch-repair endonuclease
MRTLHEIQHLLATEGVVVRRDHPKLIGTIERLVRNGNLRAVLPGVYAEPGTCDSIRTRIQAVMHWDPDAVLVGTAAAWVSFWPEIRVSTITCSLKHQRRPQYGYEFTRRQIPSELVVSLQGLRYTCPALTALDLCEAMRGDAIDQALRTRVTTLGQLHRALELSAGRKGNRTRRQLLLDSRAEPWSKAERVLHHLLRAAGITGWKANRPVVLDDSRFYVDIMFRKLKLVIEIDGRLYHTGAEVFESDRWRQNLLILDGWCVLRFTWTMIEEQPKKVVAMVREAIRMLSNLKGLRR